MPSHKQTLKHREEIHRILNERSSVSIQELSELLYISPSTVRRNVAAMSDMYPNITRTHGGVTIDAFVSSRGGRKSLVPADLVSNATAMINPGDTVYLDSGQTALSVAKSLCEMDINVVTIDINVAFYLKDFQRCNTTLIGGEMTSSCEFTTGDIAMSQLMEYRFDVAFISTNCFDLVHGVTAPHAINAMIKRTVMKKAKRRYLIAEGQKFNKFSFHQVAKLQEFDKVITDGAIPIKTIEMLRRHCVVIS